MYMYGIFTTEVFQPSGVWNLTPSSVAAFRGPVTVGWSLLTCERPGHHGTGPRG